MYIRQFLRSFEWVFQSKSWDAGQNLNCVKTWKFLLFPAPRLRPWWGSELRVRDPAAGPRVQLHEDGGAPVQEDHPLLVQLRFQRVSDLIGCFSHMTWMKQSDWRLYLKLVKDGGAFHLLDFKSWCIIAVKRTPWKHEVKGSYPTWSWTFLLSFYSVSDPIGCSCHIVTDTSVEITICWKE